MQASGKYGVRAVMQAAVGGACITTLTPYFAPFFPPTAEACITALTPYFPEACITALTPFFPYYSSDPVGDPCSTSSARSRKPAS